MGLSDWLTVTLLSPSQVQNFGEIQSTDSTREERAAACAVHILGGLSLKAIIGRLVLRSAVSQPIWHGWTVVMVVASIMCKRSRLNPHLASAVVRYQVLLRGGVRGGIREAYVRPFFFTKVVNGQLASFHNDDKAARPC